MIYPFALIFEFLFLNNVYGYIDPNVGAAVVAMIISVIAGIGITLKTYWYKLRYRFSTTKNSKDDM